MKRAKKAVKEERCEETFVVYVVKSIAYVKVARFYEIGLSESDLETLDRKATKLEVVEWPEMKPCRFALCRFSNEQKNEKASCTTGWKTFEKVQRRVIGL